MNIYRKFLLLSGVLVILIGCFYGVAPLIILGDIIGLSIGEDQLHVYRGIMGLYFGFAGFFIYASLKGVFILPALIVEIIFIGGLLAGRILSLLIDGYIHWFSILAIGVELIAFIVCLLVLVKYKNDYVSKEASS